MSDLWLALHSFRRWRLGALGAVVTLAIGIGATTALYTLLRVALSAASVDIDQPDRVGRIYLTSPALGVERAQARVVDFEDALSSARSFETLAAYSSIETAEGISGSGTISVTLVSPGFFGILRAHPAAGRLFTTGDFAAAAPVVLMGERAWSRRFPGQSLTGDVSLVIGGVRRRVVGVVPREFDIPFLGISADAWMPLAGAERDPNARVSLLARLRPGASWTSASAELAVLPTPADRDTAWRWRAIPVDEDTRYRRLTATSGTLGPALVLLTIACLNVACMLLARGVARETELSVKAALGATRGRLFRELATEHALLALGGSLGGGFVAWVSLRAAASVILPVKPDIAERLARDTWLLPVSLGISTLACVAFGAVPALSLSRRNLAGALKGTPKRYRARVVGYGGRDLVVFAEVAVAVILVVVTAMWFSFFQVLEQATSAFPAGDVLMARVHGRDLAEALPRVHALPGVDATTTASHLPGRAGAPTLVRAAGGEAARVSLVSVGERFFETLHLPIVQGRGFERVEHAAVSSVVVVSEAVAGVLWPGVSPLGQEVTVARAGGATRLVVIGVTRNPVEFRGLGVLTGGDIYVPLGADGTADVYLFAHTRAARGSLRVFGEALRVSTAAPAPQVAVVADRVAFAPPEATQVVNLCIGFALAALFLAGAGIFGVISQSVAQRTREFGIRIAVGSSPGRVLRLVLVRECKLIAAAIACGAAGTVAATRVVFAELVTISALNPGRPSALMAMCGLVAAAAVALATWRIIRLDPLVALKFE